ncbi:MAG: hypothetical protein R3F19_25990 [Verrucomicrobiales bacterium]
MPLITRAIAARPVKKGEAIFQKDISGIESVDLGVSVSDDAAIVVIRSSYWKRSLFYDFGPLHEDAGRRTYDIDKALGQQMTLLLGLPAPSLRSPLARLAPKR